jgi:hypothetical protein
VGYLRLEGYTQDEIGEIFQVHRRTIARDEAANRREAARLVDELDVRSVAGGLIAWARHLAARAMKDKDYALVWRIQRELVGDLQRLGYLPRTPEQISLQIGSFVDLARMATAEKTPVDVLEAGPLPALPEGEGQCLGQGNGGDDTASGGTDDGADW